jgi:SnoaL-like domain
MKQYADVVDRYLAVWNETDAMRRRELIAQTWADGASYRDPLMQGDGRAGIDALVQGVHQQFPGYRFRQVGAVDGHHSYVRFAWELGPEDGPAPIAGSDVAILAPDGRLQSVIGFLDRVPTGVPEA